jgi:hypothetical protein
MGLFKKIFGITPKPGSYAYKLERAKSLHGQVIKYVTERKNDNDDVIGRGGALTVHNDTFIVDSSGERIFVCNIDTLEANWLMSGDGVVISGVDLNSSKERTVTVHFVYHRK